MLAVLADPLPRTGERALARYWLLTEAERTGEALAPCICVTVTKYRRLGPGMRPGVLRC